MIDNVVTLLSWACLLTGGFLGITGAVGLFRFPDFFTRLHAASVTDTLCVGFILAGLMLQSGWSLTLIKLILILITLSFTSPTSAHSLAKAALHGKLKPMVHNAGEDTSKS